MLFMNVHARFVNLIESLDSFKELTPTEYFLINKLISMWDKKAQVTVNEVLMIKGLGSRAKLHRDLMSLKDKGFIGHESDEDDQRVKYVVAKKKLEQFILGHEKAFRLSLK